MSITIPDGRAVRAHVRRADARPPRVPVADVRQGATRDSISGGSVTEDSLGWLCIRDYTGPDYKPEAKTQATPTDAAGLLAALKQLVTAWEAALTPKPPEPEPAKPKRTVVGVLNSWAAEHGTPPTVAIRKPPAVPSPDGYFGSVHTPRDVPGSFYVEVFRIDDKPVFKPLLHEASGLEAAAESIRAFGRSTSIAEELSRLDFTGCTWPDEDEAEIPF